MLFYHCNKLIYERYSSVPCVGVFNSITLDKTQCWSHTAVTSRSLCDLHMNLTNPPPHPPLARPSTRTLTRLCEPPVGHAVSASGSDLETTSSTLFLQHSTPLSLLCSCASASVLADIKSLSPPLFSLVLNSNFSSCFRLLEFCFFFFPSLSFFDCFAFVFPRGVRPQEHTFPIDAVMTETAQSPDVKTMS